MHSARLGAFSLLFLALLAAAAGSPSLRACSPSDAPPPAPSPPASILWKTGPAPIDSLAEPAAEAKRLLAAGRTRILLRFAAKPDRNALRRHGIELLRYLPKGTWIARLTEEVAWDSVGPVLRWAGSIPPSAKIAAGIAEETSGGAHAVELRVRFHDDVDLFSAAEVLRSVGGSPVRGRTVFHGFDAIVPAPAIEALAERDEVLWIGAPLPPPVDANDGIRANANIDSVQAAPYSLDGTGARVGIWDGGRIDAHTDFSGRLTVVDASAVSEHSTHVAGTLAGSGALSASRGGSALQWRGAAPGCAIYSYDYYGDLPGELGAAITAYAIDASSNSWVLDVDQALWGNCYLYGDYDGYAPELDEIVGGYFGKRIAIVVAAGNERNDGDCAIEARSGYACIPPPGTAKNVITVGAIHTNNSAMTAFSSYGPVDDGRVKPDLVAGGCQSTYDYSIWSTWPGNQYGSGYFCGTSMAAPAVAGGVAVLVQAWKAVVAADPGALPSSPLPSTLKALLLRSADDLGNPGPDYRFGYGRMNLKRAVDWLRTSTIVEDSVGDGDVMEWTFPVPPSLPSLKIALVWDDPAGTPLADPALVNDLDLVLVPPAGAPRFPYVLDPGNPAAAATTGVDRTNNVEEVVVASPVSGVWTARVTGSEVPVGSAQRFSLVGIDTKAPGEPAAFTVSGAGETSIQLSWNPPSDADARGVLLVRSTVSIVWAPEDGIRYSPGQEVEDGVVVVDTSGAKSITDAGLEPCTRYHYRCFAYDRNRNYSSGAASSGLTDGACTAVPLGGEVPRTFELHGARPNPFNPTTRIRFDLPETAAVRLVVYDIAGRVVRVLVDETLPAGSYEETWDGTTDRGEEAGSGVYHARLEAGSEVRTTRLQLVR